MSYILDALKKAENERGLSAAPPPQAVRIISETPAAGARPVIMPALLVVLALTALGLLALFWNYPRQHDATYTVTVTTAPPDPAVAAPLSTPAIMSAVPAPRAAPTPPASAAKSASAHALTVSATDTQRKTEDTLPELRDLPEATQRDIPPLAVSGYIYATQPQDRSVIINRKFLREGEQVSPDLVLERLTPDGMVLNFRGQRFRTAY